MKRKVLAMVLSTALLLYPMTGVAVGAAEDTVTDSLAESVIDESNAETGFEICLKKLI